MGFYQPFEQPIQWDRAYLFHMAQVVSRGEPLYIATTYGYTPLGTLIVGGFMWLGKLMSIDTFLSAKVIGILLYGLICGQFYLLSNTFFVKKLAVGLACVFFMGLGYLPILSGINAEPKLWVLFFSILGMRAFLKSNWLLIGLYFSLAAMCWHAAVISLFTCFILLLWKRKSLQKPFFHFIGGISLGSLPLVVYLFVTNSWLNFWNQAVLRKLVVEGEAIGESPFTWLLRGIYPFFVPEPFHFILGFLGFCLILYFLIFKNEKLNSFFRNKKTVQFLIVYSLTWGLFNSMEFQTPVDLFPLIPAIILFCVFFIQYLMPNFKRPLLFGLIIISYNFYDAFMYDLPFTLTQQKQLVKQLQKDYGKAFVIGFEEFYTILELPMPTRFMRYTLYENHLIEKEKGGCTAIKKRLKKEGFQQIIEMDLRHRNRSKNAQAVIQSFQKMFDMKDYIPKRSDCAEQIIKSLSSGKPTAHFNMKIQSIPLGNYFYTNEFYSIYTINKIKN